jgi:hypothetical protein
MLLLVGIEADFKLMNSFFHPLDLGGRICIISIDAAYSSREQLEHSELALSHYILVSIYMYLFLAIPC